MVVRVAWGLFVCPQIFGGRTATFTYQGFFQYLSLVDFGDVIKKDESQPLIKCPRCKKGTPLFIQAEGRFNHRTTLALQIDL